MNIDRRVDEIVESLSVEKLVQFAIAQALGFDSYREYSSAFREQYDEIGHYINKVAFAFIRKIQNRWSRTPMRISHKVDDALYRAVLLIGVWGNCYQHVAEVNAKMLPQLALLAEKQATISLTGRASLDFGADVEELLATLLRTHASILTIRDRYFEGRPILFKEDERKLNVLISEFEEMARLHNILEGVERVGGQHHLSEGVQCFPSRLDVAKIKLDAQKSSDTLVRSLVAMAESGAHAALGHRKRAMEILISSFNANQL